MHYVRCPVWASYAIFNTARRALDAGASYNHSPDFSADPLQGPHLSAAKANLAPRFYCGSPRPALSRSFRNEEPLGVKVPHRLRETDVFFYHSAPALPMRHLRGRQDDLALEPLSSGSFSQDQLPTANARLYLEEPIRSRSIHDDDVRRPENSSSTTTDMATTFTTLSSIWNISNP